MFIVTFSRRPGIFYLVPGPGNSGYVLSFDDILFLNPNNSPVLSNPFRNRFLIISSDKYTYNVVFATYEYLRV